MAEENTGPDEDFGSGPDSENEQEFAFETVGERLRNARIEQNKDIADIAARTRIPSRHLEAIENGDYSALPGRTYAVGFVKAYARAVDLSETELAGDLKDEMGYDAPDYHARGQVGQELDDPSKIPSSRLAWMAAIVGIVILVGGFAIWRTYFFPAQEYVVAEEPIGGDVALQAGTQEGIASAPVAQPAALTGGEVVFIAKEEGPWVRFYEADGNRLFEGTMKLGERFVVPADAKDPEILTGRPDAFAITIGGQPVPPISTELRTVSDVPVSAAALLARPKDETPGIADAATAASNESSTAQ